MKLFHTNKGWTYLNKPVDCDCGLQFESTQNGYTQMINHLDDLNGMDCDSQPAINLHIRITEKALELFRDVWGHDTPV